MQVKQITSEMQQFLPTASGAAGLQRNSGWLCNAKGFFFLRYICKIPGSACGSCMQPLGEEHTPEEFLPTFHRCYLNVRAESFLQFVYSKQQIKPHKCARRCTPRAARSDLGAGAALPGGCQLLVPPGCSSLGASSANPSLWPRTVAELEFKGHSRGRELCEHSSSIHAAPPHHLRAVCATSGLTAPAETPQRAWHRLRAHGHLTFLLCTGTVPRNSHKAQGNPGCTAFLPVTHQIQRLQSKCSLPSGSHHLTEPGVRETSAWSEKSKFVCLQKSALSGNTMKRFFYFNRQDKLCSTTPTEESC